MQLSNLILRGLEWVFAIIIMALDGNIIAIAGGHGPAVVNYVMFTMTFAMLSLFYLTAVAVKEDWVGLPILPAVLDALNVIFTLTAAIAIAAELGAHSCNNLNWLRTNKITHGSKQRCREAQATTAFEWFIFVLFFGSLVISVLNMRGSGVSLRPRGIRKGGPSMSQV